MPEAQQGSEQIVITQLFYWVPVFAIPFYLANQPELMALPSELLVSPTSPPRFAVR